MARNTEVLDHVEDQLRMDRGSHRRGDHSHHHAVIGLNQDNLDMLQDYNRMERAKSAAVKTGKKKKRQHKKHHSAGGHGHHHNVKRVETDTSLDQNFFYFFYLCKPDTTRPMYSVLSI